MKNFLIIGTLVLFSISLSAQKYISKNGHIWFYSHTPLEEVEAHNRQVASILDKATGDISFKVAIKSFEFKVALMQEHFNENYLESDKYPKADFKGTIVDNASVNYNKDGIYNVEVKGELTIHGVTKSINTKGTIEVKEGSIIARSKFSIVPKDYDIKIPSLVENKIAKEIDVTVDVTYLPYKP